MSMQYKGGVLSATAPTTSSSSAKGIWTMRQQLQAVGGTGWPNALAPSVIGQAFGGGFYAGKIAVGGSGVATHYLIVAPKATGESSTKAWGVYGVTTGATSVIAGPTNTATLNALGSAYEAAQYCVGLNAGAGLNSYTDWYLPAKNELEVLYYFLKPATTANNTSSGSNANAVSPEPVSQNYTSGSPAQTSATGVNGFRTGEANAFEPDNYQSSTEYNFDFNWLQYLTNGWQAINGKQSGTWVRAVRRVPI